MIVAVDLSTHKVGIYIDNGVSFYFDDIIGGRKYQIGDIDLIELAGKRIANLIEKNKSNEKEQITIVVEYSNIIGQVKYLAFCTGVMSWLARSYYKVVPVNEARWLKIAQKHFEPKRTTFADTRIGNKQWIKAVAERQGKKFDTQDEYDAYLMYLTYWYCRQDF